MMKVILASASKRRSDILNMLDIKHTVMPASIDESCYNHLATTELVQKLAFEKANAIAKKYSEGYIIGSDTIVLFEEEIILKPKDFDDALRILKKLNGKTNEVYTGISVIDAKTGISHTSYDKAFVTFKNNSEAELISFIKKDEPYDKSGSYSVADIGSLMIQEVRGDFYCILGLSVRKLSELFKLHNISLL